MSQKSREIVEMIAKEIDVDLARSQVYYLSQKVETLLQSQLTPVAADTSESLANGIRCQECWAVSGGHLPTCSRR